jgi:transposase
MRYTKVIAKILFLNENLFIDLREKIVAAHLLENISIRKVAAKFSVSKSLVQKLVKQQRVDGNLKPKQRGKPQFSHLKNAEADLRIMVADNLMQLYRNFVNYLLQRREIG